MIVYRYNNLKMVETRSDKPNEDWTGEAEFVIDETDPNNINLIGKINSLAPYFEYVIDENGDLIDVVESDVVINRPEPVEDVSYDELADAIQEGVNEV